MANGVVKKKKEDRNRVPMGRKRIHGTANIKGSSEKLHPKVTLQMEKTTSQPLKTLRRRLKNNRMQEKQ